LVKAWIALPLDNDNSVGEEVVTTGGLLHRASITRVKLLPEHKSSAERLRV
jgi:hypothetical protein